MKAYWIEGLFASAKTLKKRRKNRALTATEIEPYAATVWANSPEEAAQLATEQLQGGEWVDGPHISQTSEEQRMRSLGAPELPGLGPAKKGRKR